MVTMELDPTQRYQLPVVFGPARFPDVSSIGSVRGLTIPFRTERSAMAKILPPFFEPADPPIVSVGHMTMGDVDYMGGRGYKVVRVTLSAVYRGSDETINATYTPVAWESDTAPIVLGRELSGYAKLFATIPDLDEVNGSYEFSCYEYEACLIRGHAGDLRPLPASELANLQVGGVDTVTLGWKYIPGTGRELAPDVNYPVVHHASFDYQAAWRGSGAIEFDVDAATGAPYSAHIIAALAELPVLEHKPALMVQGSMKLPRTEVRRLH